MNGEDYVLDAFDDGSAKRVGEILLGKMRKFVEDHAKQLKDIEEALDESLSEAWDSTVDPIGLDIQPYEQTKILELIKTDNKLFDKVLIVFVSLCAEMRKLENEAREKYYAPLLIFGEEINPTAQLYGEGHIQVKVAKLINPFLIQLSYFVNRCYVTIQNVIRQLASLYDSRREHNLYQSSFKGVHLQTVFEHLGDLLCALIGLDYIIDRNEVLRKAWAQYKRMTKTVRATPGKYNTEDSQLGQFEKTLISLEGQLFDGLIFQNAVEQEFDFPGLVAVRRNEIFKEEFLYNIRIYFSQIVNSLGRSSELDARKKYMAVSALYVCWYNVWKDPHYDKGFFKKIWVVYESIPLVHIYGNVVWLPPEFFINRIPSVVKTVGKIAVIKFRNDYLAEFDATFAAQVQQLYLQVSLWTVRIESNLSNRADINKLLGIRTELLLLGPSLAYRISNLYHTSIVLHTLLTKPIHKSHGFLLYQLIELLKAIASIFHRRSAMIGESISLMMQQLRFWLKRFAQMVENRLKADKSYSDRKVDILAAVSLFRMMVSGVATPDRTLIMRMCIHIIGQQGVVKDEDYHQMRSRFDTLISLTNLSRDLRSTTDCSFIFYNRQDMIPAYFNEVYLNPENVNKLRYFFAALRDVVSEILVKGDIYNADPIHAPEGLVKSFKDEIYALLKTDVLDRLCRDIETDLRLHIHSHLHVAERDPWRQGITDLVKFVKCRPLRFFDDSTIDFKLYVEHYLDTTFYNLTTVALSNWKTYGEMRNLAYQKYGLNLIESHLPGATLEQGIDVLEIMRNIHIFVSRYNYNLNNQIFVEISKYSENKTLDTINIGHISNSIRTHGTGIMNTTVNFTYQFLRDKFVIFSQFLFDDHIKARLYKDIKFFDAAFKDQSISSYPYDRSVKFNKEIRKLGVLDNGNSYLDQFRVLITEIGNAMGYIRLIRSGGLYYTSNAIKFVPDLSDIPNFESLLSSSTDSSPSSLETKEAAHHLDLAVSNLVTKFAEGTQYFKMLVNVFSSEFRSERNNHLRNFYMILPPLTINFVEHSIAMKDKLLKIAGDGSSSSQSGGGTVTGGGVSSKPTKVVGRDVGGFSDDGFAIGVAYVLRLLDQNENFEGLHWWESVKGRFEEERKKLEGLAKQRVKDKEEQATLVLTMKKLNSYLREFELLRFSFTGARVFFKFEEEVKKEGEEKKEEGKEEAKAEEGAEGGEQQQQPQQQEEEEDDF
eukprot:TRINITY_DN3239_c0_g1_i1.p1 TRINITY_DN3239_c0_g1~~TRINITY_DN3239_c0_g1_i1.p1  ORF type:complete len:1217 (-),score=305.58 TRINITY_DN3239_c0_g1_i1:81-3731(-)